MQSTRRDLILGAGAVGLAIAADGVSSAIRAQAEPFRFKVGEAEVVVLSDGGMTLPPSLVLPGRPTDEIEAQFRTEGRAFKGFDAEINVAIVKLGPETILIDTGGGPDFMPTLGKLAERMEAAGIKPESVTRVLFTHAHPDHFWGVVDPLGGGALFEQAKLEMSAAEFEFWIKPDVETRMADNFKGMAAGTHRRLKPLAESIVRRKPDDEIGAGLTFVDTAGHTPGHVSVLLKSGGEQLMIGGDVLSQSVVSFAKPEWAWGPDYESDKAIASRRRTLDQLATDKIRLLGYHLPWPGLGRVERKDGAYRFVQG